MARKLIRARPGSAGRDFELGWRSGVPPETINRIEQAKRSPSLATFEKLYRALDEVTSAAAILHLSSLIFHPLRTGQVIGATNLKAE